MNPYELDLQTFISAPPHIVLHGDHKKTGQNMINPFQALAFLTALLVITNGDERGQLSYVIAC